MYSIHVHCMYVVVFLTPLRQPQCGKCFDYDKYVINYYDLMHLTLLCGVSNCSVNARPFVSHAVCNTCTYM